MTAQRAKKAADCEAEAAAHQAVDEISGRSASAVLCGETTALRISTGAWAEADAGREIGGAKRQTA
jgi:hypothetical protein